MNRALIVFAFGLSTAASLAHAADSGVETKTVCEATFTDQRNLKAGEFPRTKRYSLETANPDKRSFWYTLPADDPFFADYALIPSFYIWNRDNGDLTINVQNVDKKTNTLKQFLSGLTFDTSKPIAFVSNLEGFFELSVEIKCKQELQPVLACSQMPTLQSAEGVELKLPDCLSASNLSVVVSNRDNTRTMALSKKGALGIWNSKTGALLLWAKEGSPFMKVVISESGNSVLGTREDGTTSSYELDSGEIIP